MSNVCSDLKKRVTDILSRYGLASSTVTPAQIMSTVTALVLGEDYIYIFPSLKVRSFLLHAFDLRTLSH